MKYRHHNKYNLYTLITFMSLPQDLPDSIQVGGRISPQTVWDYVEKIKASGTKVRRTFFHSTNVRQYLKSKPLRVLVQGPQGREPVQVLNLHNMPDKAEL